MIGVRPCDLQALAVYDAVFGKGPYVDEVYLLDRRNMLVISVNCSSPGRTCFCTSMNTGPKATSGFDLSLTEVLDSKGHRFLAETGSSRGDELLGMLPVTEPTGQDIEECQRVLERAAGNIEKSLNTENIGQILYGKFDDPRWEETGSRCLSCGNCTMVCPTCFCTTVEDRTDLFGDHAERISKWDSCYTLDYSYIHGGSIRPSAAARYRQWMMHKLVYWPDQFGMSGCVGCGRCITWCPAGIDITEETGALRKEG
jgi:ferredoxin